MVLVLVSYLFLLVGGGIAPQTIGYYFILCSCMLLVLQCEFDYHSPMSVETVAGSKKSDKNKPLLSQEPWCTVCNWSLLCDSHLKLWLFLSLNSCLCFIDRLTFCHLKSYKSFFFHYSCLHITLDMAG